MSTEISFELIDVTAREDSSPTCSDSQSYADATQIKEERMAPELYMTGERNHNVLDGSMKFFPENPEGFFGLWSKSMCGADGVFETPITLTIDFDENHSSLGLSFRFAEDTGDYCTQMQITWYDSSGTVLHQGTYEPTGTAFFAEQQIEDYRKLTIEFQKMNRPYRHLKLYEISYGVTRVFDEECLISARILEELDPLSAEASINTLDFTIHTEDFAILDLTGMYEMLQKKQRMDIHDVKSDGSRIPMGTFYLDEPESDTDDTTTLSCVDLTGILDQTQFRGNIYSDVAAGEIVDEIMASAKTTLYEMEAGLAEVKLSGWIPTCTHREALQMVAFVIGAVVDCARSDKIKLYAMPTVKAGEISKTDKFDGHKLKLGSLVTGAEVTSHKYKVSSTAEELVNESKAIGTYEVTFSDPMTALSVSGASITESSANHAILSVTTAGTVVLTGKPYVDTTAVHGVYASELPASEKTNVLKVEDVTLASPEIAAEIAQRIYDWYQWRYTDEGDIDLADREVGQLWEMESLNGRKLLGLITSLDIDLVGGMIGKMKMTGKAVKT